MKTGNRTTVALDAGRRRFTGWLLIGAAATFWSSWALMPGVGITDAATILKLVGAQPERVLLSSVIQLASAALLALAIPGLTPRFAAPGNAWGRWSVPLLAAGACGDAADAIFHQLAYEMTRPGVDQAAMLPIMQRMQTVDLLYLLPLIFAFLAGCAGLAVSAARLRLVPKWNPLLYLLAILTAIAGNALAPGLGISGRAIGLTCLGLLSISLAWIGMSLRAPRTGRTQHSEIRIVFANIRLLNRALAPASR